MAKATIVSEIGFGEYNITRLYNITRAQDRKTALEAVIVELDAQIVIEEANLVTAQTEKSALITQLNSDIAAAKADTPTGKEFNAIHAEILTQAVKDLTEVNLVIDKIVLVISQLKINKASVEQELKIIDSAITTYENSTPITAWCADYSLGLTGEVGTIERHDESNPPNNQVPIIYPGGTVDTKEIQPVSSSGAFAVLYNTMALPAFQKHKPRYRQGKITAIDYVADTCDLTFNEEYEFSSIVGYDTKKYGVFLNTALTAVPIVYNPCNSLVFNVDDQVVVEFLNQDNATPQVIGFITNPRLCSLEIYFNMIGSIVGSQTMSAEIDDSLNTISYQTTSNGIAGNIDWKSGTGVNDTRISWDGPVGRSISPPIILYSGNDRNSWTGQGRVDVEMVSDIDPDKVITLTYKTVLWGVDIYKNSGVYATLPTTNHKIIGAAFNNGFLIINTYEHLDNAMDKDYFYIQAVSGGSFTLLHTHTYDTTLYYGDLIPRVTPTFFNEDGTKALAHRSRILKTLVSGRLQIFQSSAAGLGDEFASQNSIDMIEVEITQFSIDLSALAASTFVPGDLTGSEVSVISTSASSLYNPISIVFSDYPTTPPHNGSSKSFRSDATINGVSFNLCADWYIDGLGVEDVSYFNITLPVETETIIKAKEIDDPNLIGDEFANVTKRTHTAPLNKLGVMSNTLGSFSESITFLNQTITWIYTKPVGGFVGYTLSKSSTSNQVNIEYIDIREDTVGYIQDETTMSVSGTGTSSDHGDGTIDYIDTISGSATNTTKVKLFNNGILKEISSEQHIDSPSFSLSFNDVSFPVPERFWFKPLDSLIEYDILDTSLTATINQSIWAYTGAYEGEGQYGEYIGLNNFVTVDNPCFNLSYANDVRPAFTLSGFPTGDYRVSLNSSFAGASITKDGNIMFFSRKSVTTKTDTLVMSYGNGSSVIKTDGVSLLETEIGDGGSVTSASFPKNIT